MSDVALEWKKEEDKNNLKPRPLSAEWPLSGRRWRSRPLLQPLKRLLCWFLKKRRGLVSGRPMKVQEKACWQCSHCALFWGLAEGLHWGIVLLRPPLPLPVSPPGSWLLPVLLSRVCPCRCGLSLGLWRSAWSFSLVLFHFSLSLFLLLLIF